MVGLQKDVIRYRLQLDIKLSPREVDTLTNQLFANRVRPCLQQPLPLPLVLRAQSHLNHRGSAFSNNHMVGAPQHLLHTPMQYASCNGNLETSIPGRYRMQEVTCVIQRCTYTVPSRAVLAHMCAQW